MNSLSRPSKAPRRANRKSAWKRRGAFFCACGFAGVALLAVSNRALSGLSIFPVSDASSGAFPGAGQRALQPQRNRSLGNSLAKIDAKTVQAWINRWTKPEGAALSGRPKLVRIDAEILAHHHPAWRLAAALERGAISPAAPQIRRALSAESEVSENGIVAATTSDFPLRDAANFSRFLPATTVRAPIESSAAAARRNARQSAALDAFFRAAAARDASRGRDETFAARRELEDAIAATRNGALPDLDLSLMSPEVALKLTNLRLQILRNLSKTPAQRAAVREEIRAIEARYAQILREETERQTAKIYAARVEIPLQKRRQGIEEIARQNRLKTQLRFTARRAVARDLNQLRAAGHSNSDLELSLDLPATRAFSAPNFAATTPSKSTLQARDGRANAQFFETEIARAASGTPILKRREDASEAAIVASLRRKARVQAQEWARLVAGNMGVTRSDLPSAPDATRAALQILFPASNR